jgi:aspartyl-tRNA synthetase
MKYFDTTAYLAQSPQFYKQMAMAAGFGRVFEIGPVFRANPSFTARHDTEFTSVDVELSWIESHDDVMDFEERLLARMLADVVAEFGDRIRDVFGVEPVVPDRPFPRITLDEAHDVIAASGHEVERAGGDLDPEGERRVAEAVRSKHGHEFVFVTDYPTSVRPFYHMRYDDRPGVTRSFDLLWKGLEVTTGAQREHRHERLAAQAAEKGLSEASVGYSLDFFKYGCPPHGGFGLGLTRLLMILLDIRNVREVTFLYRGPNRLSP